MNKSANLVKQFNIISLSRRCYSSTKLSYVEDDPICENLRKLFSKNNFEKKVGDYSARLLTDKREVLLAQHHAYNSVRESLRLGIPISANGHQVRKTGNLRYLSDNFDDNSFWTGAFHNNELICSIRTIYRTPVNQLSIDDDTVQNHVIKDCINKTNVVEINHSYTHPDYRLQGVKFLAHNVLINALLSTSQNAIITNAMNSYTQNDIGKVLKNDEGSTTTMFWSEEDMKKVVEISEHELSKLTV